MCDLKRLQNKIKKLNKQRDPKDKIQVPILDLKNLNIKIVKQKKRIGGQKRSRASIDKFSQRRIQNRFKSIDVSTGQQNSLAADYQFKPSQFNSFSKGAMVHRKIMKKAIRQ